MSTRNGPRNGTIISLADWETKMSLEELDSRMDERRAAGGRPTDPLAVMTWGVFIIACVMLWTIVIWVLANGLAA